MLCNYGEICSGCSSINEDYEKNYLNKKETILASLPNGLTTRTQFTDITFKNPKIRNRMDLTFIREGNQLNLGLYAKDHGGLVDIESCEALTPELNLFLRDLRKFLPPIKKGSLRIRIGPKNNRGLWLDFSNKDIQYLFEEKSWLNHISQIAKIEVGQRRKALDKIGDEFKLKKESLDYWFSSFTHEKEVPILSQIASFTQPSIEANKKMISYIETCLMSWPREGAIIEVGSGIGNFSIPLSSFTDSLSCLENDKWALKSLEKNLSAQNSNAKVINFDFNRLNDFQSPAKEWLLFLDPPRSGIREIGQLIASPRPPDRVIYVSCFPESFARDATVLMSQNYEIDNMAFVDQFPYTNHLELVAQFIKKDG